MTDFSELLKPEHPEGSLSARGMSRLVGHVLRDHGGVVAEASPECAECARIVKEGTL